MRLTGGPSVPVSFLFYLQKIARNTQQCCGLLFSAKAVPTKRMVGFKWLFAFVFLCYILPGLGISLLTPHALRES